MLYSKKAKMSDISLPNFSALAKSANELLQRGTDDVSLITTNTIRDIIPSGDLYDTGNPQLEAMHKYTDVISCYELSCQLCDRNFINTPIIEEAASKQLIEDCITQLEAGLKLTSEMISTVEWKDSTESSVCNRTLQNISLT